MTTLALGNEISNISGYFNSLNQLNSQAQYGTDLQFISDNFNTLIQAGTLTSVGPTAITMTSGDYTLTLAGTFNLANLSLSDLAHQFGTSLPGTVTSLTVNRTTPSGSSEIARIAVSASQIVITSGQVNDPSRYVATIDGTFSTNAATVRAILTGTTSTGSLAASGITVTKGGTEIMRLTASISAMRLKVEDYQLALTGTFPALNSGSWVQPLLSGDLLALTGAVTQDSLTRVSTSAQAFRLDVTGTPFALSQLSTISESTFWAQILNISSVLDGSLLTNSFNVDAVAGAINGANFPVTQPAPNADARDGRDSITDFFATDDKIAVVGANFGNLALGTLSAGNFALNAAADANDYFVFDTSNGQLSFDQDGNGAAMAVPLVTLGSLRSLTASSIQVIASIPS